ncbi:RNase adapter RapZ [Candidatus Magnetomonas plexicatena]|uniref:RNase adapter RapZ n=1 Tax=Candidatus Magnetomonas plexicatena TaxID=2552947 RepID=UPI001C77CC39|nr:RNase adapter RapZ [Nitrospirales bacterium LBB_01]
MSSKTFVLIVTGMSGAGKTVTLRALEDSGYFCVDNLPPSLIDDFVKLTTKSAEVGSIAIGMDVREKSFLSDLESTLVHLRKAYTLQILFLEAETDVLIRRFKETRRPHPLQKLHDGNMVKAMESEGALLKPLRNEAEMIVDTSAYTPHQLRTHITSLFGGVSTSSLKVTLISFGFKSGTPHHLDMLFDVRFLANPHFVENLRPLTGLDKSVSDYVIENHVTVEYLKKIEDLLDFLIPNYIKEGKSFLTIGIGCTGGRHRAPAITQKVAAFISKHSLNVEIVHRDI